MRELGDTYPSLARRVSALSGRPISASYVNHIINGRRRAEYLWPWLATALEAPLDYLTNPRPRSLTELRRDHHADLLS
jgi:hypothetical protein